MRMNLSGCVGDLTSFPGCGQIVVSHNVFLPSSERGKGKGSKAHKERLMIIRDLGYDYALATVLRSNEKERAILASNGWRILSAFQSTRSLEDILIYGRQIEKKNDRFAQPVGSEYYDHVDQRQQFQNTEYQFCDNCGKRDAACAECDCTKRRFDLYPETGFPLEGDSETAIHEEIQRVRQET